MEEYPSNSDGARKQLNNQLLDKRSVEKSTDGPVKVRKRNGLQKITNAFIQDDIDDVKSYILEDIAVPTLKRFILDSVKTILGVNDKSTTNKSPGSKVSYRRYYDEPRDREREYGSSRNRKVYEYDEVVYPTRGKAEDVLADMEDVLRQYPTVSVYEFYQFSGIEDIDPEAWKFGWRSLKTARAVRIRDGEYVIKLPRALAID